MKINSNAVSNAATKGGDGGEGGGDVLLNYSAIIYLELIQLCFISLAQGCEY